MAGPKVPTEEEIAWMQMHSSDTQVPNIIAACIILSIASSLFVVLRIISRRLLHGSLQLQANDWLVLLAWCLYIVFIICFGLTTRYGAGRHIIYATDVRLLQIFNLTNENLYACSLALLKWSVLLLYRQLFASRVAWFDRLTWVVATVATALALQVLITSNLQCIPIATTWDPSIPGRCFDYGKSALVAYVVNFLTELTILSMPIPLVLRLRVSRQKKWMLVLMFAAGAGTCVVSIVQLKYITKLGQTSDTTWDIIPSGLLTATELAVGFLATSIPTYRPLYQYIFLQRMGRHHISSHDHDRRNFHAPSTKWPSERTPPPNAIIVTDEIELLSQAR